MFELPSSLTIQGKEYPIRNRGDYRVILDCFVALNDAELDEYCRVITCLIIFYEDINSIEDIETNFTDGTITEAVDKMYTFFNCGQTSVGASTQHNVVDWCKDSHMIASAINNVCGKEIRAVEYCHWWTFMGYYLAIGDCAFSTVIGIRHKLKTHKKLEKYEKEFKQQNPELFIWDDASVEQKEAEDLLRALWNKK